AHAVRRPRHARAAARGSRRLAPPHRPRQSGLGHRRADGRHRPAGERGLPRAGSCRGRTAARLLHRDGRAAHRRTPDPVVPTLDGFHLPGLALEHAEFDELRFADDVIVRVPRLDADAVRTLTDALISARARTLANVPIERIIAAVDTVARRLADRGDALRRTAETALPAITSYHPSMIALVLDRMSADWRAPALLEMLRTDLGGPEALDRFVERAPGVRSRAFGPHLVTHVFAGNVPGVAVTSLVRALLVRAASLGKTASGEPLLAPLFARALAEEWSDLGDCIATTYWAGGSRRVEDVAFEASDAVVVYGGRRAADDVRARVPAHVHLLDHGPRISFAAVGADVLPDENSATRVIAA